MDRREWDGRPVKFGDFTIKEGRAVREAFPVDGENASYLAVAYSMRYADTGELVFKSVEEVWAQPNRLQQRIMILSGEAMQANGWKIQRLDEDPAAPKANGHDTAEQPAPSP